MKENPRPLYATGSGPTRASSPRQLPTDQDYAVPTREYQTDQSSQKLPRPLRALPSKQLQQQQQNPRVHRRLDTVTPYQCMSACGKAFPTDLRYYGRMTGKPETTGLGKASDPSAQDHSPRCRFCRTLAMSAWNSSCYRSLWLSSIAMWAMLCLVY